MEWLIFTLKSLLPNSYPKDTNVEVIESTINYMKELEEKLSKNQQKYPKLLEESSNMISSFSGFETESEIENILIDLKEFYNDESQNEFGFDTGYNTVENILIEKFWTNENMNNSLENTAEEENQEEAEKQQEENQEEAEERNQEESKIKRPWNGFIRFSKAKRKEVYEKYPTFDNRKISVILGCMWRKLPQHEKNIYVNEFNKAMKERRVKYPNWNYAASRAKKHHKENSHVILTNRLRPRTEDRKTKFFNNQLPIPISKKKKVPKTNMKSKNKEKDEVDFWVQCDLCGQWRKLLSKENREKLPDIWNCSMNSDPFYNNCIIKQEQELD